MSTVTITLGGIETFDDIISVLAQTGAYKTGHRTFAVLIADLTTQRLAALRWLQDLDEDITITGLAPTPGQEAAAASIDLAVLHEAVEAVNSETWWSENHG
jgi:hypothetical protein